MRARCSTDAGGEKIQDKKIRSLYGEDENAQNVMQQSIDEDDQSELVRRQAKGAP